MASSDARDYNLAVTAGTSYSPDTHLLVPVNTSAPLRLTSPSVAVDLQVLIQAYRGFPEYSPSTHPYFQTRQHKQDLYSLRMNVVFKEGVNGDDLVFGNDFDKSIWNSLPIGFNVALNIVKYGIDPGIDGDVRSDKPYLYGPVLSSMNIINVSDLPSNEELPEWRDDALEEDMTQEGEKDGEEEKLPIPADATARRKFFLRSWNREKFVFEKGEVYSFDFFNSYIDFNEFKVKLPGFSIQILKYWDGQPLRYVLKNRKTGEVYCVIVFTLSEKEVKEELEDVVVAEKEEVAATKTTNDGVVGGMEVGGKGWEEDVD